MKTKNTITPKETTAGLNGQNKWWILVIILVVFFIPAILFLNTKKPEPVVKSKPTPPVGEKIYTDTLHVFKITIPGNWTTTQSEGTNTTGLNTAHPVTQQIEITQLYIPPEEGITIQVYKGVPTCPLAVNTPTTTLADFPAFYDPIRQIWTIPTTKATLMISISYPGSKMFHLPPSQTRATPVPSIVAQQNEAYVMKVLKTMKLTNLTPFSCQ